MQFLTMSQKRLKSFTELQSWLTLLLLHCFRHYEQPLSFYTESFDLMLLQKKILIKLQDDIRVYVQKVQSPIKVHRSERQYIENPSIHTSSHSSHSRGARVYLAHYILKMFLLFYYQNGCHCSAECEVKRVYNFPENLCFL